MADLIPQDEVERLLSAAPVLQAIARHGSFATAAIALDLDPSAISHRVRALEKAIGMQLFERGTRQLRMTRSGCILCEASENAVTSFARALDAARELKRLPTVRLSVMSSLAMKWLIPRLGIARDAGIDVSLEVMEGLADLNQSDLDAALRFGEGPYPGLHARRLVPCELQPVISPALAQRIGKPLDPLGDHGQLLLGDIGSGRFSSQVSWETYAEGIGRKLPDNVTRQDFSRADFMLQAAIGGLGIALGNSLLIKDDVKNGLLIPAGPPLKIKCCYWLVASYEKAETDAFNTLHDWLMKLLQPDAKLPQSL